MDESTTYSSALWVHEYSNNTIYTTNSTVIHGRTTANSSVSKFYPLIVAEMILSIICLILSMTVYNVLPEFKNVHGKNLTSLSACLLTTYVLLCLDLVLRLRISYAFCFAIAVVIHVTFLATFFWTNVMAFDIWNNMTSMKRGNREVRSRSRKYLKYSIYAWTATALTALPAVVLEATDLVPPKYRPAFGVKRCWLSGTTAFIYYFNLPVGVILLGNLVMFALTIRKLWIIKKMTSILNVKQDLKRLNLYFKLFFVMGFVWFTEFLPWITKFYKLYALAGILTAFHGVFLFCIFTLKWRVLSQIKEKIFGKATGYKSSSSQQTSSTNCKITSQNFADTEA